MKHLKLATICLVFAMAVMVVADAEAGKIKKPPKGSRTEKPEHMMAPHHFDYQPEMTFVAGVLSKDPQVGWKVGDTPLYLSQECVIYLDGTEDGWLEEGRDAVVMGSKAGEAISAWSVHMGDSGSKYMGTDISSELKEPGKNPNVGMLLQPVQ